MTDKDDNQDNVRHLKPQGPVAVPDSRPAPAGKLWVTVTYLEMKRPATRTSSRPPRLEQMSLMRAHKPTVSFYRYLYNTVGERWLWYERRQLNDADLLEIIHNPENRTYVLHIGGTPAGFAELDLRQDGLVNLAYFGLIPEFIGRGLGQYFLDWAVDKAWSFEPRRVTVNTCDLDHPKAIAVYQQAGFVPYRQEQQLIDDPRVTGAIPV